MATVYRKSAKGQAEIDTRAHRLAPRLRTALILVDGKRSDADLRPLILQQPDETLAALLQQGFIETVAAPPPSTRPRPIEPLAPAGVPAATHAAPGNGFEELRREAARALIDQVGPMAEALAMRIEKVRSLDELQPLLEVARQVIANSRGGSAAQQYATRFQHTG